VDWTLNFSSNSLVGWKKEGEAFAGQPVFVDEGAFEDYAGDTVCPGCYVESKKEGVGVLTSKSFTLKRNTVEFKVGGGGPDHSEKVEVVLVDEKGGDVVLKKVMPPGNGDDTMFPVFLDVAEHKGKEVFFRVSDPSEKGGIKFDDVQFYNDQGGCLPECLKIEASTCGPPESAETCFYFENSDTPYTRVKATSRKSGLYCLDGARGGSFGAEIGKGLKEYDIRSDYLAVGYLPRCMHIEIGSKFGISLTEDSTVYEFKHAGMLPVNLAEGAESKGEAYCVYNTLKPYCAALYAPLQLFKPQNGAACRQTAVEDGCLDLCYNIHCAKSAPNGPDFCGSTKMFDDCANCCARNKNIASGCFRRRRRLSEQVWEMPSAKSASEITEAECADKCVKEFGCIAFYLKFDEGCVLAKDCNPEDKSDENYAKRDWWGRKDAAAFARRKKGAAKRKKRRVRKGK